MRVSRPSDGMTDQLRIPLASMGSDGFHVDACVSEEALRPEGARELSVRSVHVKGILKEVGTEYLFRGTISGAFSHSCDRCLAMAEHPFEFEAVWLFEHGSTEETLEDIEGFEADEESIADDDRVRYFQGGAIDLAPHVWEELVLVAPSKFLCGEDCRGLCEVCGANLNETQCSCSERESSSNSGLAALADMFPDLRPESSEE